MKNLLLFSMLFMFTGMLSAQTCSKSKKQCKKVCASKAAATEVGSSTAVKDFDYAAADKLAEATEDIVVKECSVSGKHSYYQKHTCSTSGKVSMKEVNYDAAANAFVNVAPSQVEGTQATDMTKTSESSDVKKTCSKAAKKSCAKTCASKKASCSKNKKA